MWLFAVLNVWDPGRGEELVPGGGKSHGGVGYKTGVYSPCLFHNQSKGVAALCHGDDIVFVGKRRWLEEANKGLGNRYGIKSKWIGPGKNDSRSGQVLGRVITYSEKGIKYEADPRHAEIIVEMLNLTQTKPVRLPG